MSLRPSLACATRRLCTDLPKSGVWRPPAKCDEHSHQHSHGHESCGSHEDVDAGVSPEEIIRAAALEWQLGMQRGEPMALRFPIGAPVHCRIGADGAEWATGTIVKHSHREPGWPVNRSVPYQVLLDADFARGERNAVWSPADVDECIRAALRFRIGDRVECRLNQDTWARGHVVAHFYRESKWPLTRYAPYQIQLDTIAGAGGDPTLLMSSGALIYAPEDDDACIRKAVWR